MAFENIDTTSLETALISCKSSLNYAISRELINTITNTSVWQADAEKNLYKSLDKLINTRYKELMQTLIKYTNLVSSISEYQQLQKENKSLDEVYPTLQSQLYYTEYYTTTTTDINGKTITQTNSRTVKNRNIEMAMNENRKKYRENKNRMETLKNQVSNSI